jgi:hypothetical protein
MQDIPGAEYREAAEKVLDELGFSDMVNNVLADAILRNAKDAGTSLMASATSTICRGAAFGVLFIVGFILIRCALGFAARFISKIFNLPVLNMFNKAGGAAFGLLYGLAILFILGWGLRFMGAWLPGETIEQTYIVRHFTDAGLLDRLSAALAEKL